MRLKLLSAFLGILMISGIFAPLMMVNNTNGYEEIKPVEIMQLSDNSNFWFHDGSNMTGFSSPVGGLSSVGSIASSGTYFYATDVGSGTGWHGPLMSYTLEVPFKVSELTRFDTVIDFDCLSSTNRLGTVSVILHDSNEELLCGFSVTDAWADDRQLKLPFTWSYLNGSSFSTPSSEPSWVTFSPYYETLSLTNTSTGFQANIPDIGIFDIPVSTAEELNRVVSYVTISFRTFESWTYCEEVFLQSINLEWTDAEEVQVPLDVSWHHDCSNTSLFDQYLDWPMDWWWETYTVSSGTMFSDGSSLSFSDITYASPDWYGPIFVHNITEPFTLDKLEEYTVELDIDNSDTSDAGIISVYLCDADYMPAIRVFCSDSWNSQSSGHNRAEYRFSNGSYVYHGNTDYITWTSLNDSISIWSEPNGDLFADVPGYGSSLLLESEFIEHDREIHHVVIQTGRLSSYSWMPSSVRDIKYTIDSSPTPWYHDCSNTTAFDGVADDTWYDNPDVHIDGSIASTDGYIYADDYGTGSVSYGPMMYHNLTNPFNLASFESLSAEFEFEDSTDSRMGAAAVVLFDQNNDTVITINVADSWDGYSVVSAFASYDFANGTRLVTPWTNPTWTAGTPYREMISVIHNSTGIYASIPRVGNFEIISAGSIESNRTITSIAVNFRASATSSISEINRIHEIYLNELSEQTTTDPIEPFVTYWHDDCSNITDWTYHTEWDGYTRWGTASGTLASTGASIHCPTNSGWETGPFWFKEFSSPFSQEGFTSWDFDFQVTQPSMSYKGNLFAGLFGADKQPIFVMQFTSWNELEHELDMYCYYRFNNGTWLAYQRPSVSPNFDGVVSISYEEGVGIVAHIGASDSGILLTEAEWNLEPAREITYFTIFALRYYV